METNTNSAKNVKDGVALKEENKEVILEMVETIEAKKEAETVETAKKKQKVSATYTLRACGENARKLLELKLITEEECEVIQGIQKKALEAYIKTEMGL